MLKNIIMIPVVCLLLIGCKPQQPPAKEQIDLGQMKNNVYTNRYFDLSISLPPDWVVQSTETTEELAETGIELLGADKTQETKYKKAMEQQVVSLFSIFQYELGAPVNFNPNIICNAERISHVPGIKRGSDYHYHSKKVLESGQLPYEFPEEIYTENISGISFDVMPMQLKLGPVTIYQKVFATKIKDYMFVLTISGDSKEQEDRLMEIVKTLKPIK